MIKSVFRSLGDPYNPVNNARLMGKICQTLPGRIWCSSWEDAAGKDQIDRLRDLTYEPFSHDRLERCADGTLGHAYNRWVRDFNIPIRLQTAQIEGVVQSSPWYVSRLLKTHDLHHVLLGIPPSEEGEVRLQGVICGISNLPGPFEAITAPVVPYLSLKAGRGMFREWVIGYRLGKTLKGRGATHPFLIPYEDLWESSLEDVRLAHNY